MTLTGLATLSGRCGALTCQAAQLLAGSYKNQPPHPQKGYGIWNCKNNVVSLCYF